jgi:hypothetical protein
MLTMTVAALSALAFLVVGSGPANAFGGEVLGCSVNWGGPTWTANSCGGGGSPDGKYLITYAVHNLSGTYSYNWTVTAPSGGTVTTPCPVTGGPCVYSGCTATSSTCTVQVGEGIKPKTFTATLVLTQSGQSRTLTAQASIPGACDPFPNC